jgi:aminoglycoside phosphotransferase family enzyme/predicted kinase
MPFPSQAERQVRHETHMSVVSVFEDDVLKVLKPVHYPFVDLSTEPLRRAECHAEVAHNAAWAPGVYRGVLDVSGDPPRPCDAGEPAIWMRRLPADRTLTARADVLTAERMAELGRFIRARHDDQPARPGSASEDAVWHRIDENVAELLDVVENDRLLPGIRADHDRMQRDAHDAIARRAGTGRLLHGDLRCEHVYDLGGDGPDDAFAILDGVAFSDELASGDPIEDVAFLAMDLGATLGRHDLVASLWEGWGGAPLVLQRLYAGHRSLIRAKVGALSGRPDDVVRHLLHARVQWADPMERPVLIGVGGLPGVGKSTLARAVAEQANLEVLRTDVIRKQLGPPDYSVAGRTAVYDALNDRARAQLTGGGRVLIDASYGRQAWRDGLFALGRSLGVPTLLLLAEASEATALARIARRTNDASDADADVHRAARAAWEPPTPATERFTLHISTEGATGPDQALAGLLGHGFC